MVPRYFSSTRISTSFILQSAPYLCNLEKYRTGKGFYTLAPEISSDHYLRERGPFSTTCTSNNKWNISKLPPELEVMGKPFLWKAGAMANLISCTSVYHDASASSYVMNCAQNLSRRKTVVERMLNTTSMLVHTCSIAEPNKPQISMAPLM